MGLVDYKSALEIQNQYHKISASQGRECILGFEHPAVLTLGYRARDDQNLSATSIPTVKIERGGLATIHSEGQLVIYPIINLKKNNLGVRNYVSVLLNTTQQLLKEYEIVSQCKTESAAGLFTEKGKIAFCGIQIKNGTSLHGISLNVKNNLQLFDGIISCGISQQKMDRMADHGRSESLDILFKRWCEIFNCSIHSQR